MRRGPILGVMPAAAPRIDSRLVALLDRLDDRKRPIAETHRLLGAGAEFLDLPRPSYEQTRVLVHDLRRPMPRRGPNAGQVLLEIAFRARPPDALLDYLSGVGLPRLGSPR